MKIDVIATNPITHTTPNCRYLLYIEGFKLFHSLKVPSGLPVVLAAAK
jgi:hypothetical protein